MEEELSIILYFDVNGLSGPKNSYINNNDKKGFRDFGAKIKNSMAHIMDTFTFYGIQYGYSFELINDGGDKLVIELGSLNGEKSLYEVTELIKTLRKYFQEEVGNTIRVGIGNDLEDSWNASEIAKNSIKGFEYGDKLVSLYPSLRSLES